ncbi:unnamed protein product [Pedinophyceae sp. YPF-701]|nr:unnamed protein product [Pedinophyceae sp. YPF-701]
MGGGKWMGLSRHEWPHFTEPWSTTGWMWPDPKGWRRNTAIAGLGIATVTYMLFRWSVENEVRTVNPREKRENGWIPSQLWYTPGKQILTMEEREKEPWRKLPWEELPEIEGVTKDMYKESGRLRWEK